MALHLTLHKLIVVCCFCHLMLVAEARLTPKAALSKVFSLPATLAQGAKFGYQALQQVITRISGLRHMQLLPDPPGLGLNVVFKLPKSIIRGTQSIATSNQALKANYKVVGRTVNLLKAVKSRVMRRHQIPTPRIAAVATGDSKEDGFCRIKRPTKFLLICFASAMCDQLAQAGASLWIFNIQPATNSKKTKSTKKLTGPVFVFISKKDITTPSEETNEADPCLPEINARVGDGATGTVREGVINNIHVAFKIPKMAEPDAFEHEAQIQATICHENIVSFFGVLVEPRTNQQFIVMERVEGGSLHEQISQKIKLSRDAVIRVALDVAQGLQYLHSQKIVHCDIKPQNILLSKERAKICDFGAAMRLTRRISAVVGTLFYMAPEILQENPFDEKADVFSFGATLFEIISLVNLPILTNEADRVRKISDAIDDAPLRELIIACCRTDPSARPSFTTCIELLKAQKL